MMTDTILVTGAAGFVGNAIVNSYSNQAVALIRDRDKRFINPTHVIATGDLRDRVFVNRIMVEYDPKVVIHCAASAIVHQGIKNPEEMYSSNVIGTLNLLEACKRLGNEELLFIYFGTDKVLSDCENAKEDAPYHWNEMGPYEKSKAMAEVLCQGYASFFKVCNTRSGNIYGPNDTSDRLIPNNIRWAMQGQNPRAYNEDKRQYVYIGDVVRAVKLLIHKRQTGVWHIGSPDIKTTLEVAEEIAAHFKMNVDRATPDHQFKEQAEKYLYYIHNEYLNFEKLQGLGWQPRTDFEHGIEKTIEWWRDTGEFRNR